MVVTVLGMVAELERRFIRERQQSGIEAAKARGGVYKGRRPTGKSAEVIALHASGMGPTDIARRLNISRMTVYRIIKSGVGVRINNAV